jgi:hypothetical protein
MQTLMVPFTQTQHGSRAVGFLELYLAFKFCQMRTCAPLLLEEVLLAI